MRGLASQTLVTGYAGCAGSLCRAFVAHAWGISRGNLGLTFTGGGLPSPPCYGRPTKKLLQLDESVVLRLAGAWRRRRAQQW